MPNADVMILGSDAWDFHQNEYFHPRSRGGMILSRILKLAGKERSEFSYGDIRDVQRLKPKCILALGDAALFDITGMGGRKQGVNDLRGYVLRSWDDYGNVKGISGLPVVCSYSPESLMGRTKLWGVLLYDLMRAMEVAQRGVERDINISYNTKPVPVQIRYEYEWLLARPNLPIAYDIENPSSAKGGDESELEYDTSTILQIQFSSAVGLGIALDWDEHQEWARRILALPNPKWTWNGQEFDDPILRAHGCEINGERFDLMWLWHSLQPDLPKGLQYVTSFFAPHMKCWKHTSGNDLATYGCADVDATYRIGTRIFDELRARKVENAGIRYTHRTQREVCDPMSLRGFCIDAKAQDEFKIAMGKEWKGLNEQLQALIPAECKKQHRYKGIPTAIKKRCAEPGITKDMIPGYLLISDEDSKLWGETASKQHIGLMKCDATGWYIEQYFLSSSSDQVKCYIRYRGYEMPKMIGDASKDSTGKKQLQQLYKKTNDEAFRLILEMRALDKLNEYLISPDEKGKIYSIYRANGTGSGQMSSWGQREQHSRNMQNWGKDRDIDKKLRNTIIASPGCKLIEIDLVGFHAQMLGFLAECPIYIRVSKLDVHSYVTAAFLRNKMDSNQKIVDPVDFPGVPQEELDGMRAAEGELRERLSTFNRWFDLSDADLGSMLGFIKRHYKYTRNRKIKSANFGIAFGMGAKKMYEMYIENFRSLKEAMFVQGVVKATFPKVFEYQESQVWAAHNGPTAPWLYTSFGTRRAFYEAKKWDSTRGWTGGSDAEKVKAFGPSAHAHCYFKEALLRCAEKGYLERYRLQNLIHDATVFDCPDELVDECIENISTELQRPSPCLIHPEIAPLGFSVETDAQVGRAWGSMVDYKRVEVTVNG